MREIVAEIVYNVINDIEGRKGLGDAWEEIDDGIKEEIFAVWAQIVIDGIKEGYAKGSIKSFNGFAPH